LKGERLNALEHAHEKLLEYSEAPLDWKLEALSELEKNVMDGEPSGGKYLRFGDYEYTEGRHAPCFYLLEKCFPFSISLGEALDRIVAMKKQYGDRAKQASSTNVDWKAMMHAVRVSMEAEELLTRKWITLPFTPDRVNYLLQIKRGEHPIELVKNELHERLETIKAIQKTSGLPVLSQGLEDRFKVFMTFWLRQFYNV
jgi:hypothetical protein